MNTITNSRQGEKGFTLVELAIVMMIIGLLIGGILKGQELVGNARIASSVSKVKAIDAAITTFRDSYQGMPGDIRNATTRLPNCAAGTKCGVTISGGTRGNGQVASAALDPGVAQGSASENIVAWAQLAAADMLGGIQNAASTAQVESGVTVPNAEVPGQIYIGYASGTAGLTAFPGPAGSVRAGHYLLIHDGAATAAASSTVASTATAFLTPNQAARIDQKVDDGSPNSGTALAMGTTGATGCATGADLTATNNVYATANQSVGCGIYIRIQQ